MRVVTCYGHEGQGLKLSSFAPMYSTPKRKVARQFLFSTVQAGCDALVADLRATLAARGVAAEVDRCARSMSDDFVRLASAPRVLSSGSSFSFMAGFFGAAGAAGGFVTAPKVIEASHATSAKGGKGGVSLRRCTECERRHRWYLPAEHVVLHGEVQDYFNLSDMRAAVARPPLAMARDLAVPGGGGKAQQKDADAWRAALPASLRLCHREGTYASGFCS